MFCKNCGKELIGTPELCPHCGARPLLGNSFCQGCGAAITPLTEICMKCGIRVAKAEVVRASWEWLALPILVGWIGGLIAYFRKRKLDPFRAKVFLWVGIGVGCAASNPAVIDEFIFRAAWGRLALAICLGWIGDLIAFTL